MKSSKHIRSWIIKTLLSENQAIGIYEAEVYWKKYPQEADLIEAPQTDPVQEGLCRK